jgi:hypothetical protein
MLQRVDPRKQRSDFDDANVDTSQGAEQSAWGVQRNASNSTGMLQ